MPAHEEGVYKWEKAGGLNPTKRKRQLMQRKMEGKHTQLLYVSKSIHIFRMMSMIASPKSTRFW
jgi:hypothetical protein